MENFDSGPQRKNLWTLLTQDEGASVTFTSLS